MNQELLMQELAVILEVPRSKINNDTILEEQRLWDSLSMISLIGFIDDTYKVLIPGLEFMNFKTVKDVISFIEDTLKASK
jgi:acyl carrier protein